MSDRYIVVEGSDSGHCCFDSSVLDTTKPVFIGGVHFDIKGVKRYEAVCECFDEESAIVIAEALNIAHKRDGK